MNGVLYPHEIETVFASLSNICSSFWSTHLSKNNNCFMDLDMDSRNRIYGGGCY